MNRRYKLTKIKKLATEKKERARLYDFDIQVTIKH